MAQVQLRVAVLMAAHNEADRVVEVPVAMEHRPYGRTLKGFWHRGKQYRDIYPRPQLAMC